MNKTAIILAALQYRVPNELIELSRVRKECNSLFGDKEQFARYKELIERKYELESIIAKAREQIMREINSKR